MGFPFCSTTSFKLFRCCRLQPACEQFSRDRQLFHMTGTLGVMYSLSLLHSGPLLYNIAEEKSLYYLFTQVNFGDLGSLSYYQSASVVFRSVRKGTWIRQKTVKHLYALWPENKMWCPLWWQWSEFTNRDVKLIYMEIIKVFPLSCCSHLWFSWWHFCGGCLKVFKIPLLAFRRTATQSYTYWFGSQLHPSILKNWTNLKHDPCAVFVQEAKVKIIDVGWRTCQGPLSTLASFLIFYWYSINKPFPGLSQQ